MGNGLVNVRDQKFILFEQLKINELFNSEKYGEYTVDDANMMLGEAEKLAVNVMEPTYAVGDQEGCTFVDGRVKVPACFHDAYKKICEGGGIVLPEVLKSAVKICRCSSFPPVPNSLMPPIFR